ncbi:MAG: DUF835 domain-containing protein [Methanobacteriota archaeon]|nr:MAG: DUF835 domain-containing protein [Euryarchaeota archaeon]
MFSRRRRVLLLAVLVGLSVVNLIDRAEAQTGSVRVATDLQLIGLGRLGGGGHVTWTLTGEEARALRTKILGLFDEYPRIPQGFGYAGTGNQRVGLLNDGVLQAVEANNYTDILEKQLEAGTGIQVRYVRLPAADILERGLNVDRSTDGLVGTTKNSTERLEIRFIFNAETLSENWRFRFSDVVLANALHTVFDLSQATGRWILDPWWPLLRENGWQPVGMTDGLTALWHGNVSTITGNDPTRGRYDNATASTARTYTEPSVAATDLRFAHWANVSFRYLGGVSDAGDSLRLQASTVPPFNVWTDLAPEGGVAALPNTPAWRSVRYNVTAFAGEKVRFRLNFTSNATGNSASGFFVRDFAINAPSRFVGTIESSESDFLVGTSSFQDFDLYTGRAHLLRTPAGEVLLYGSAYNASSPPLDSTRLRGFDALENPQVLFVLLIVAAYLTSWLQDVVFLRFRTRHPMKYRGGAVRMKWLSWVVRAFIILYIVFYFVPSFFVLFGAANAFITGPIFWAFSVSSTVGLTFFTWFLYERQAKLIPPEEAAAEEAVIVAPHPDEVTEAPPPPPPDVETLLRPGLSTCAHCAKEIADPRDSLKCLCGQVYHRTCAAEMRTCPNCQRTLEVPAPSDRRMVTTTCSSCGEIQVVAETADLMQTRCEACGALMKDIETGYNYLVVAPENDLALEWFHSIAKRHVPGLAMSTTFPDKLRKQYGFEGVDLYWLTDTETSPKAIDPKRIDFEMMRALSNFIKKTKGGAVLLDGLEYLIVENSFERVLKLIKKVNDLASVHEVTFIVPVTAGSLGSDELTLLRKEFDRVIETSGRASPLPPRP